VIDHWPESEYAIASQIGLIDTQLAPDPRRDAGQIGQVDKAFEALLEAISKARPSAKDIYELAMRYRDRWPAQAAKLHKYNAEHSSKDDKYTLWSQVEVAKRYIQDGNDVASQGAIDRLMGVYRDHPELGVELCKIANTYLEALVLDPNDKVKSGYLQKAKALYQYVLDHSSDPDVSRLWAKAGLIRLDIASGNDRQVLEQVDRLIAGYKAYDELAKVIFGIGEQYWQMAIRIQAPGGPPRPPNDTAPHYYYTKAMEIWERIIADLEPSIIVAQAYHVAGDFCLRVFRDYPKAIACYQAVVNRWPQYEYAWLCQARIAKAYKCMFRDGGISEAECLSAMADTYHRLISIFPHISAYNAAARCLDEYMLISQQGGVQ